MRAERTGTAERPCPRSREKRSPATAGAASPARAATFTTLEPRSYRFAPLAPAPPSGSAVREHNRQNAQADDEEGEAGPEHRPVKGDPWGRVHLGHRPERCQGGEPHGDGKGHEPAEHDARQPAERRPPRQDRRFSSEGTKDLYVLAFGPKAPAYREPRHEQGDEASDGPEHPEGDGLRLARPFDLSFCHRGDVEGIDAASREELDDLSFDGGDVRAAVSEPEPVRRVRRARVQASCERRGEKHVGGEAVDVVVHDLSREGDEPDELGGKAHGRLGRRRVRPGRDLGRRQGPERDALAQLPAGDLRGLGRRDHLVVAGGVGHASFDGRHAVWEKYSPPTLPRPDT